MHALMNRPKKILIVTTNAGFLQKFEDNDVRILIEYGFEVHYASNFDNPVYEFDEEKYRAMGVIMHPIPIQKSPKAFARNLRAYRALKRIIREEGIGYVHCHNPIGGVLGRLAASGKNKPYVIYTAHGFHFYEGAPKKNWLVYYPVEKLLARKTDLIITINKEDYNRAGTFHLKKGGYVAQIHGVGVDTDKYIKRAEQRQKMREQLKIPEGAFHVVSVAELNANKNQSVIIDALSRIQDPDIYFTICGKGVNPQISTETLLIEKKKQYTYADNIRLLGYRNDIEQVLQSADLFAFPSKREGLGVAAIEAMACSVPVLAAKNRGTNEYMQHGANGYVCTPEDAYTFAMYMRKLKEDAKLRERFGENARKTSANFSIQHTDQVMRSVYRKMLEA